MSELGHKHGKVKIARLCAFVHRGTLTNLSLIRTRRRFDSWKSVKGGRRAPHWSGTIAGAGPPGRFWDRRSAGYHTAGGARKGGRNVGSSNSLATASSSALVAADADRGAATCGRRLRRWQCEAILDGRGC